MITQQKKRRMTEAIHGNLSVCLQELVELQAQIQGQQVQVDMDLTLNRICENECKWDVTTDKWADCKT